MKFLLSLFVLFSFKAHAFHFVEVDALNPVFYAVDTAHSFRTDVRFGRDMGTWNVAFRYANELGIPGDEDGANTVKAKDGDAHHFGLRGAYFITQDLHIGGGYIFTKFNADTKFNGSTKTLNQDVSGFEFFMSQRWNFDRWYVKSELGYHHIFGNLKRSGPGGYAEYDVGQGKLSVLIGYEI